MSEGRFDSDIEARRAICDLQDRVALLEQQVRSLQFDAPRGIPAAEPNGPAVQDRPFDYQAAIDAGAHDEEGT
jgi:hypothetical protein